MHEGGGDDEDADDQDPQARVDNGQVKGVRALPGLGLVGLDDAVRPVVKDLGVGRQPDRSCQAGCGLLVQRGDDLVGQGVPGVARGGVRDVRVGVGALVGAVVTKIGIRIRTITDDPMLATITALATPFITFFLAEEIGGSGVLAVVTCGIVISRFATPHMSLGSRVLGTPFWTILTYILNTILFVMVGVALPGIAADLPRADLVRGLILIPIIYIAMVAGRFAGQHLIIYSIRALDRRPEQRLRRTNIRGRIVSTVAGFRGAISLAMALSIPTSFDGAAYTERNLIILVVAGATLLSLLIQGVALPYVVRWANARPSAGTQTAESVESQETEALAEILVDTISQLDVIAERVGVDDDAVISAVRADYVRRHNSVSNAGAEEEARVYCGPESTLRLAVIEHLRERVHDLRFAGRIDDSTASNVNRRLDVETLHINGPITSSKPGGERQWEPRARPCRSMTSVASALFASPKRAR